ncbi:MAG: thioredoxin family protein [Gemmatimonadales bacterium]|nr:thioredoxin family protein [Gemmatimonadales bacterium]
MEFPETAPQAKAKGITYPAYLDLITRQAAAETVGMTPDEAQKVEFTKLNLHRSERIGRTWKPSETLAERLVRIESVQLWMVLTEPWCGDSAQCLPAIATLAQMNSLVDLRLVLRDENLPIMDQFLTDGKRSIPRLVIFDSSGRVLGQWGPRPAEAQAVFDQAKTAGLEKPEILEKLHLWYGRDRGSALDRELSELLEKISTRTLKR